MFWKPAGVVHRNGDAPAGNDATGSVGIDIELRRVLRNGTCGGDSHAQGSSGPTQNRQTVVRFFHRSEHETVHPGRHVAQFCAARAHKAAPAPPSGRRTAPSASRSIGGAATRLRRRGIGRRSLRRFRSRRGRGPRPVARRRSARRLAARPQRQVGHGPISPGRCGSGRRPGRSTRNLPHISGGLLGGDAAWTRSTARNLPHIFGVGCGSSRWPKRSRRSCPYLREPDVRYEVDVLRGAGDPVDRAGDGAAHHVADAEGVEDARELRHDEDGLGEHQYPTSRTSHPKARTMRSGSIQREATRTRRWHMSGPVWGAEHDARPPNGWALTRGAPCRA